jgi:S-adenosylmethionine:tRNA ribosyltransferase-isomerase
MLVISREKQCFRDDTFSNFNRYIRPGDCLVLNNTRVFPARLRGNRNSTSGAEVEVFFLRALDKEDRVWNVLVRPGKRVRTGDVIVFPNQFRAEVRSQGEFGERTVVFPAQQSVRDLLQSFGETPLPPYIHRRVSAIDRDRYQTVFAQKTGSVAAPTAGLHFTLGMLEQCRAAGAEVANVTLHIGLGTFAPLRAKNVADITLHTEGFDISALDAQIMQAARRLFCIGTTSVRVVETAMLRGGLRQTEGETNLFIYPGFRFQATGALLTNFHLPQSSLLMLVCAFAGRELTLEAYRHAVSARYSFFSYGDCMLIE